MAGTSVDEAQNYCLKRRKRDDTASAQKQRELLNRRRKSASVRGRHKFGGKEEPKEGEEEREG
ncbi:unnamed protein product [Fusarium venenatum]|uniref:IBB domain-containing protein n=1 Tax=Fusarium venenatum TaxID=56646 RepID=A0A2L2TW82_9HYPO|nr:uncharacterized protein FVRRES_08783 [Fusarium venenatum]CEI68706.1 unnamed protein product [Fusarium venenatum]